MSRRRSRVIATLTCIIALGFGNRGFGQAHDDDHAMSPFEGLTRLYKYPDGSKEIEEKLTRPAQNIEAVENVETLLRSPTGVDPELADDDAPALKPYLRSSAQMPISAAQGAEGPVARNEAVYTYGYTYKETQLSEETSQQVVTHETRTIKRPVIVSERNVPSGQELNGLDVVQARRKLEEERGGLKDQLEQIGVEKSSRDYKDAGLKANVYVERKNDPPRLEIRKLKDRPARLVWTYIVKSDNLKFPLRRRFFVSIDNRDDYDYKDYVYGADAPAGGSVKGTYLSSHKSAFSPTPNTETGPLANVKVTRGNQTVFTGPDGSYHFAGTGAGTIVVSLDGPFCHIVNQAGASIPAVRTGADFSFNASGDEQLAQVTSFKYVNEVGEFTKHLFASSSLPVNSRPQILDNMDVFVNLDETCNAFFDGESLNFFISGPCLNSAGNPTGEVGVNSAYSDVVYHEYGHGLDDALGRILDGGYSEGFGDALAILITHDHLIAPGWKKRTNGSVVHLRDAKNTVQWPDVQFSEVHRKGTVYGGFVWSLIENLDAASSSEGTFDVAKSLILGAALRNPTSIPDAVLKSFLFDFESGGNHYEVLKAAAKAHGLPFPANRSVLANPAQLSENLLSKGDPSY